MHEPTIKALWRNVLLRTLMDLTQTNKRGADVFAFSQSHAYSSWRAWILNAAGVSPAAFDRAARRVMRTGRLR